MRSSVPLSGTVATALGPQAAPGGAGLVKARPRRHPAPAAARVAKHLRRACASNTRAWRHGCMLAAATQHSGQGGNAGASGCSRWPRHLPMLRSTVATAGHQTCRSRQL